MTNLTYNWSFTKNNKEMHGKKNTILDTLKSTLISIKVKPALISFTTVHNAQTANSSHVQVN